MTSSNAPHIQAIEAAKEASKARLHVFVAETQNGLPAISCIYALTPKEVVKEVIFVGEAGFDALRIVRLANKSMNATNNVVTLLLEMYASHKRLSSTEDLLY